MLKDPIVEEVREIGKKLFNKFNNDFEKYAKDLKSKKNKRIKEGWKFYNKETSLIIKK